MIDKTLIYLITKLQDLLFAIREVEKKAKNLRLNRQRK